MANERHLLLTARGTYTLTADEPEIWQNAIRMTLVFGSTDDNGTLPNNWDAVEDNHSDSDGGVEYTANFGINGPPTFTFDPLSYLHDYAVPTLSEFYGSSAFSTKIVLTQCAIYPEDQTGHAQDGRSAHATWDTPVPGTGDTDLLPLQVSRGVSWSTPRIGPRGRGRIYLAGGSKVDLDADGGYDGTRGGDLADAAGTMLEGLAYTGIGVGAAQVRPAVIGSPWTMYGTITGLRVSDVFDTQRRRRDRLVPGYASRSISY